MKTLLLLFLGATLAFAQPPTTIRPGSQLQSAVVNANFGGLYSGRVGRWSGTGAPGNVPFSIIGDLYYDTTTPGKVYGCYRIGCTAVAANNWVVVSGGSAAGASNDIQVNVSAAFGGARGTIDSSGNAAFPGTVTTGSGCSGCAGSNDMIAGTPAAVPANSFGWGGPATMTTSVRLIPPNAVPSANQVMLFGAPSSNVSQFSWTSISGTGSFCMTTSCTMTTPALGTPSAAVLTNATGLPIAGLTGLGTGVATALAAAVSGTGAICLASGSSCGGGAGTNINAWSFSNTISGSSGISTAGVTWGCGFWLTTPGQFGHIMLLVQATDNVNNYEFGFYNSTGSTLVAHTTPAPVGSSSSWITLAFSAGTVTFSAGKYYFAGSAVTSNTASLGVATGQPLAVAYGQIAASVFPASFTPPADAYVMSGSTGGNVCPAFLLIP